MFFEKNDSYDLGPTGMNYRGFCVHFYVYSDLERYLNRPQTINANHLLIVSRR